MDEAKDEASNSSFIISCDLFTLPEAKQVRSQFPMLLEVFTLFFLLSGWPLRLQVFRF